jgi:hypothetical protein
MAEYKAQMKEKSNDKDQQCIEYVKEKIEVGRQYRNKFKDRWDQIEEQIRQVHPSEWDKKDSWQTKIFIPQQFKKSETAYSYLESILFGSKRFFSITGVERRDKEIENDVMTLMETVFERGRFMYENSFVLKEAVDLGTGFVKLIPDKASGVSFVWRSAYNIIIDSACGNNLDKAAYIIDQYTRPLTKIINDYKMGSSLYSKEAINKLIEAAKEQGTVATGDNEADQDIISVKNIDGTDVSVSKDFAEISIDEFYGAYKVDVDEEYNDTDGKKKTRKKEIYEERIITIANKKVLLRNDKNILGFKPFCACRVKPRKYDFYGLGYLDCGVDMQELMNSMVNLGFDSLKLCSMDIAAVDVTKVKDTASLQYKPKALWLFKDNPATAMQLTRQGMSALTDILRGITMIDQFDQEGSGILRQVQGAPEVGGGGSETLGEFNAKLAMVDKRFLSVARFIEKDYIEPLLIKTFMILFNRDLNGQADIDRILGYRIEQESYVDPITGATVERESKKSVLDFEMMADIAKRREVTADFKASGVTSFTSKIQREQKIKELLSVVLQSQPLQQMTDVKKLYERALHEAEIPDVEDLLIKEQPAPPPQPEPEVAPPPPPAPPAPMMSDEEVVGAVMDRVNQLGDDAVVQAVMSRMGEQ